MMINDETLETITCFNPKIIKYYNDEVIFEEGCLSYPDLFIKISRPKRIVVKYEDEGKELHKVKLTELPSRVFQHEYDHMEGTNFTRRVSKLKLDMAKKRAIKMKKRSERIVV